jgi:hypothetical protein
MESSLIVRDGLIGPGVIAQMKRILMSLGFTFFVKSIFTECTLVLFLQRVSPEIDR